jgi:hypothetical protein
LHGAYAILVIDSDGRLYQITEDYTIDICSFDGESGPRLLCPEIFVLETLDHPERIHAFSELSAWCFHIAIRMLDYYRLGIILVVIASLLAQMPHRFFK